ncbi:MAG: YdeI/OmpD-associated family protein [Chloroflexota bacterium]|nr:YdeI/OmpD-associated family protein [Chloroflexota bacterium]
MAKLDTYPSFAATSRRKWRDWLLANHDTSPGIWLVNYRPGSGQPRLRYDEAVEEALCFGWIDSQARTIDDERAKQLYTPRRRGSGWSRLNKQRIDRLLTAGLMHPAGVAKMETAQRDGSWTIYDAIEDLAMPDDLVAALAAHPTAGAGFLAFSASTRKQLLWWIASAKRPETRSNRIERVAAGAVAGKTPIAYQRKRS